MQAIKEIIDQLKTTFIQPVEPIPNAPDLPVCINPDDTLVVRKVKNHYLVENLSANLCFTVSKINATVYCSCEQGKDEKHCLHKIAVWKEAQKLKKMRADECIKRKIGASMSAYIFRIRQIVADFERRGDTKNCTYWYYRGQLQAYRHNVRIVIEA
ncbi:MAG: hypothetical protein ABRQ39_28475 [Candidatus Eremiobacterota bacterium]